MLGDVYWAPDFWGVKKRVGLKKQGPHIEQAKKTKKLTNNHTPEV